MRIGRLLLPALLGLALYWALFGGEYTFFDVRDSRRARVEEAAELERLRHEIDSLGARADSLEGDSATLERIAREQFGMVREGEVLYRFVEPEDSAADSVGPDGVP